ncbi:MAG: phosphoribosylformylglycinamidine synthase subunit PurQ [Candidatus Omnitrophica bacterium]|nr:phosphoribosylformylglycinamidine synthase subunit PurQ [Candidatus Omnitrophota bacterium]
MKFGVVVFPGSNCDQDCFYVIKHILDQPVQYIWHKDKYIDNYDCIILPGGFSYGDYLRTGAIAKFSPVMKAIIDFAYKGGMVIGICNGFQILLEAGLLPGAMLRNKNIHFICKHVYIKTENSDTIFTNSCKKGQILKIPIAHNEGCYYIDEKAHKELVANRQIVFRYCSRDGFVSDECNPNGAIDNIASIVNKKGNVLGMMPHPERSSEPILGSSDGLFIFNSVMKWAREET